MYVESLTGLCDSIESKNYLLVYARELVGRLLGEGVVVGGRFVVRRERCGCVVVRLAPVSSLLLRCARQQCCVVVCGAVWWFVVLCGGCGGVWWWSCVVLCGSVWWCVVVVLCGGV